MSSSPLQGQTCVVTGASSGIGRATAVALAAAGATVYAVARRRDELEVTASLVNGGGARRGYSTQTSPWTSRSLR